MARTWIVVGDSTSHGGTVVSGSPFTDIDGKPVARVGDKVTCPKCGPTTIANGEPTIDIDGKPVARHGDKTACGATLISGQQVRVSVDTGGGQSRQSGASAGGLLAAASSIIQASSKFDERFRIELDDGQPAAGVEYEITRADGSLIKGVTDSEGTIPVLESDRDEIVELRVFTKS